MTLEHQANIAGAEDGPARCMEHNPHDGEAASKAMFPSPARLVMLAVVLPGAVALTDQMLFESSAKSDLARTCLYPWMVVSTAVLSWYVGRYLQPTWLRWIVFAWCLALLDLLTVAACLSGPLPFHFGFVLVSAQVSLLLLWAFLSTVRWQWRLPGMLVAAPVLIHFASSFGSSWSASSWHLMMVVVSSVIVLLCGGLRLFGFRLEPSQVTSSSADERDALLAHQFGVKHLLIWATALAPLLVLVRGLDFFLFMRVDAQVVFPAVLAALTIATVNLLAIWAVLGRGPWIVRAAIFLAASLLISVGLWQYFRYVNSKHRNWPGGYMLYLLVRVDWMAWLWLDAALLAALLLFIRANGYLLVRTNKLPQP